MRINIDDPSAGWGTPIIIWLELVCAAEQSVVSRVLNLITGYLTKVCYLAPWTRFLLGQEPFKPRCPHTNSSDCSLYIFLENLLGEFDKRSKHFPFGDHFISSPNLFSWLCTDFVEKIDVGHSWDWRIKSVKVGSGQFTLCVVPTIFFPTNLIPWCRVVRKVWSRWLSCQSKRPVQWYFIQKTPSVKKCQAE